MSKRFVHPEGSESFPQSAADEETLLKLGFVEEKKAEPEKPKRKILVRTPQLPRGPKKRKP